MSEGELPDVKVKSAPTKMHSQFQFLLHSLVLSPPGYFIITSLVQDVLQTQKLSSFRKCGKGRVVSHQFPLSAFPLIEPMVSLHRRRAAAGARLDQTRGKGAERRTGAGGQPRVRAVEQPFPVLSFQAVIHGL